MALKEKRKEIYTLIMDEVLNKKVDNKKWQAIQKDLSKMLKGYSDEKSEPQIVYKEKVVYREKKSKTDNYWSM